MAKLKKDTIYETPGFRSGPVVSRNPKGKVTKPKLPDAEITDPGYGTRNPVTTGKLKPVSNTVAPKLNNRQPVSVTNPKKSGLTATAAPKPSVKPVVSAKPVASIKETTSFKPKKASKK